ncbi:MAG TPA: hypothetical protein VFA88_10070 [Gaiellaceae bacterium]|nr:hypothetical protein [Gaiellaceae bacterium]
MRRLLLGGALLLLLGPGGSPAAPGTCPAPGLTAAYARKVDRALASGRDVWGEQVLRAPNGPSYSAVRRYLRPLLRVGDLTDSGVYYLAFGRPNGPYSLHVADGGELRWRRASGPRLRVVVGGEPYGSCLARLATPRLAGGWLPILETRYADGTGHRYREESFATSPPDPPASYLRLAVPAGASARIGSLAVGGPRTVYVAFDGRARAVDAETYARARANVVDYWKSKLASGTSFDVPDARVDDAVRNLLVQELLYGWRYSVGNAYQLFEFPESLANASVLGEYGFAAEDRAIVEASFHREPHLYRDWEQGQRLLELARAEQLAPDRAFLDALLPRARRAVAELAARIGPDGLLPKARYASDLPTVAYSVNGQAVDLQGLRAIAPFVPAARAVADRLARGLRAALNASERRLDDGSLFVPVRLLDDEAPYEHVTDSRAGSYWNLAIPDVLASGLVRPGSEEANGVLRYLLAHGSRLLGLVRFDFGRPNRLPGYEAPGSDDVYALGVERFLADNHQADLLALTLYGQLGAGMTENTFVSGEGATIAPVAGEAERSMYLPPNSTSNASFLECLRLLLVHETAGGVELAYGTPRWWLAPGKRIAVRDAPTAFGRVSYTLTARRGSVDVDVSPPAAGSLSLRLRLQRGERLGRVTLDGRPLAHVDRRTGTIDLGRIHRPVTLTAHVLGAS